MAGAMPATARPLVGLCNLIMIFNLCLFLCPRFHPPSAERCKCGAVFRAFVEFVWVVSVERCLHKMLLTRKLEQQITVCGNRFKSFVIAATELRSFYVNINDMPLQRRIVCSNPDSKQIKVLV